MSPVGFRQDGFGAVTLKTMPSGWIEQDPHTVRCFWSRLGFALEDGLLFALLGCVAGAEALYDVLQREYPAALSRLRADIGRQARSGIAVGRQDYA